MSSLFVRSYDAAILSVGGRGVLRGVSFSMGICESIVEVVAVDLGLAYCRIPPKQRVGDLLAVASGDRRMTCPSRPSPSAS